MTNLSSSSLNPRLWLPELIWLEAEQIAQAKALSESARLACPIAEAQQWQSYLNALALLGFEQWLRGRLLAPVIVRSPQPLESVSYLEVSGFTFGLITVEHVLDETVRIPQAAVDQLALMAHFYVLQEVSEEQALVTIRGFCRYDELINYRDCYDCQIEDGCYLLPLAFLDAECNHLLFYCRSLQPAVLALPRVTAPIADRVVGDLTPPITQLTQWLQGNFAQNWQMIEQLISPDANLSFATRSLEAGASGGKLINLGVQLGPQAVVLLVTVTAKTGGKLGVLVQLHPTGAAQYLMPELTLSLRSAAGKTLQAVTSRSQDNYIQLKPFKGSPGTRFSVALQLDHETVEENFEL
jgi:Protein of unknown function (DUF1822)